MNLLLFAPSVFAATLSGTVRDADGAPLARATVQVWNQALDSQQITAESDGSFTIADLPPAIYRLRATPARTDNRAPRFLPDERDFCSSVAVTLTDESATELGLDFTLPEGATVSGRLLDPDGAPVEGLTVWVIGAEEENSGWGRPALSDAAGDFVAVGLDAPASGPGLWAVGVVGEGWPTQYGFGTYDTDLAERFEIPALSDQDLGDWELLPGIVVRGTATGPDGPLADADVHVYANSQIRTVQTEADGSYEADGLPAGDVLPWVSAEGHGLTYFPNVDRPTSFLPDPGEGNTLEGADLVAPFEATLPLRVVDAATGLPLAEVQVLLYNDTHTVGRGDRTDESGLVTIDQLFAGEYELYVWASDSGHADDWVRDADGEPARFVVVGEQANEEVEVALAPAASLHGTVTDDAGLPIEGASITASLPDGAGILAQTDAAGEWALTGLAPGEWSIHAGYASYCPGDPGYVTVYWEDEVDPGVDDTLTIEDDSATRDIAFVLPVDIDHDGMSDRWEEEVGLDPSRDDALEDPDEDGALNLQEYWAGTDPFDPPVTPREGCGCGDKGDERAAAGLLLPLIWFGRRRRPARETPPARR